MKDNCIYLNLFKSCTVQAIESKKANIQTQGQES